MKKYYTLLVGLTLSALVSGQNEVNLAQSSLTSEISPMNVDPADLGNNGFKFETVTTGINSKYAEYGVGFFREKFIFYSAKKIGAIAKKDPVTKEPFTKLFCSDIDGEWDLRRPLLFSHILNKNDNLGTIAFSADGKRIYYTKSTKENSQIFQIYTAEMNPGREGEWILEQALPFNNVAYSFENPHISRDNKTLYFSSNMPDAIGGFDIFKVNLLEDGTYGPVQRIEGSVNTVLDEKFPHTSLDGKYLYFSSTGHNVLGGFDVFRSRKAKIGYVATRNLGNTINSKNDEIAFVPASKTVSYLTSDRTDGKGSYDIYKLTEYLMDQFVEGTVIDEETKIPLENANVVLLDAEGIEVSKTTTNANGKYRFSIDSFLDYTLLAFKDGFERGATSVETNTNLIEVFDTEITLKAEAAEIVETEEKSFIKIDNIFFEYNSAQITKPSTITLNKVVQTLRNNPNIKVSINAHTDSRGQDAYNLDLSERRAVSAKDYILNKGIDIDRLISKGYGESQPIYDCLECSEMEHQANRRIEFIIIEDQE